MSFVYILKSAKVRDKFYIGITNDVGRRMKEHAKPKASHYRRLYAPWRLETYVRFKDKRLAEDFERYLKTHSGRAFLKKRFLP